MDEYGVLRESAGIGAISARAQIAVGGRDRATYLQGLITNDIVALTAGSGCYAAWLNAQGRMLTDLHVLESGDMILLDVPAALADTTVQRLDQFLFSEDVQLASLAETIRPLWVHGPAAAAVLANVLSGASDIEAWRQYQNARLSHADAPVVVARIDQLGVPGYCIYVAPDRYDLLSQAVMSNGARAVGPAALAAARIEAGYPVFGVDMTDDTIPLEAGIEDRAISFTKGCYVGQEVIIRVLHRGGGRVARKLMALRIDGVVPSAGTRLLVGDRDVGFITSAAVSPVHGSVALGYVHRDVAVPGSEVTVAAAGGPQRATVSQRPMSSAA